jgi:hypothetical protein
MSGNKKDIMKLSREVEAEIDKLAANMTAAAQERLKTHKPHHPLSDPKELALRIMKLRAHRNITGFPIH